MSLQTLFADESILKRYVAEVVSWDTGSGGETISYFSGHGFTTGAAETPANTYFSPRIIGGFQFQRSMFDGSQLGGRGLPSFGDLVLANDDGGLDELVDNNFDGRQIIIRVGADGDVIADFLVLFDGLTDGISFDDNTISIRLRDRGFKLDRVFHRDIYPDTADVNLVGQPIPECYGQVFNVTPILTDEPEQTFQVHNGRIESVTVYDDQVDITAFVTADLTAGTFKVDVPILGAITADVEGDKRNGLYRTTVADILTLVAQDRGLTDFDDAAIDTLNDVAPQTVGAFVTSPTNTLDVFDVLINSVGAFYGFNRAGEFTVGCIESPVVADSVLTLTNTELDEAGLERLPTLFPRFRTVVGYAPNFTLQQDLTTDQVIFTANFNDIITSTFDEPFFKSLGVGNFLVSTDNARVTSINGAHVDVQDTALTVEIVTLETALEGLPAAEVLISEATPVAADTTVNIEIHGPAGAATSARVKFARQLFRTEQETDSSILNGHPQAQEIRVDTALALEADADAEAARLNAIYKIKRDVYANTYNTKPLFLELGETITIQSPRFDLADGKPMLVVGVDEDVAAGLVTLTLWG